MPASPFPPLLDGNNRFQIKDIATSFRNLSGKFDGPRAGSKGEIESIGLTVVAILILFDYFLAVS
jgi:hypothetical protein